MDNGRCSREHLPLLTFGATMNISSVKKNLEAFLENLRENTDISELRNQYGLTSQEIEGYLEFFAENKITPLITVFRGCTNDDKE